MITTNYPALLAALLTAPLALAACAKAEDLDTDTAAQTTAATTTAGTTGDAGTSGGTDATTGEGTTQSTTPTTGDATSEPTTSEPTTSEPTTGEGTTGGDALSCSAYCATISANCTGAHTQYGAADTCMASCAAFMPGLPADTGGNTLGCRSYHAGAAKDMPEIHCTHAGPGGAGVCGANCDGFCTIAAAACPEVWPDDASCQTACASFSPDESYDATDVAGNTLACRLYHLTAATVDPATHCAHIKGDSAPCQ